jgi:hypothetical protein
MLFRRLLCLSLLPGASQTRVSREDASEDNALAIDIALERSWASPIRDKLEADEIYARKLDSDDPH